VIVCLCREGSAASGEAGVRRRRKGGCVEVIETFKEWETMRSDAEISGKRLLVVYTGPDGGGKAVEDLERIAGEHSLDLIPSPQSLIPNSQSHPSLIPHF
jgi:hypothetical protein